MQCCNLLSLQFHYANAEIYDLDKISEIEKIIEYCIGKDFMELKSTEDWYQFEDTNMFDYISENIKDNGLRGIIYTKLCNIYSKYVDENFYNENAITYATQKSDEEKYYALPSYFTFKPQYSNCNKIYSTDDYQSLHESYLSSHPTSNENYAERCSYIFEKIKFDSNFVKTLSTLGSGKGIVDFSEPVTQAISTLNRLDPNTRNIQEVINWIKSECGYDCSPQGSDKGHLKCKIELDDGSNKEINCEFHIKISNSNLVNHVNYYTRIYFGLLPLGQKCYSYIFHCGKHL
ncbi:hypothetical protein [Pantoea sp. X85]|uniref:hypothetical protein n=1 Tax=Pantoea sp. X85 TaxID=3037258 RepID=UPI0024139B5C|nr:hypothetical protein [Pantoea sp. X85]WFL68496.1 hypothetical protein P6287_05295 [Pantoea sp. X85]